MSLNTKQLTFNTILSNNKSISNPLFVLHKPIISADSYAISAFCGVNTIYTIDQRNNKFSFVETTSDTVTRTAVISSGNYTLSTFLSELGTQLSSQGTTTYTVTNNTLTNRLTITSAVEFKIVAVSNNVYYESGFIETSTFALAQTGTSSFDLSGLKAINIVSSSMGYGNSITVGKNLNIICSIPISSPYQGVINFSPTLNYISAQINEISTIDFSLYDERLRPLIFDKDFSLSIMFQY